MHGTGERAARRVPDWIRRVVRERLARMSDLDRAVVLHATVLGYRFDPMMLASVMNRDIETLIGALQRARDCNFIVEDESVAGACRFRHAIVRRVLLDDLKADVIQRLRETIALRLEGARDART
jgi:predicted ATPase